MRVNIELDEALISEAFALTGLKTRRELVNFALQELVRHKKQSASKSLCDAFNELHQLELADNPFPETKRENRPNPFP
ncbi:type II toxin-antitoxin system VapB family antitoxin [Leucothrix mucor]|uniref:type II toxin-antitoxin system VapB family antitoxin n=1 Tax=Leucothrix mucor TaxID=45248 RepID=UPI0003B33361|nr:type II toxin-antitoxin system VapB family antitoxin [Leucothrix mucor]